MKKSISQSLTNDRSRRLRALIDNNSALLGELADAKVCNTVAIELYQRRTSVGITQKELAERIGVKQSNISRWEKPGYQGYKVKLLSKIARALDGELYISLTPPKSTYTRIAAFELTHTGVTEVTSPDGWKVTTNQKKQFQGIVEERLGTQYAAA